MSCWEILGIEPTGDREAIRQAYERQMKFASAEEARKLDDAFREAAGEEAVAKPVSSPEPRAEEISQLDAHQAQVVREVVIQIKALMNDSGRQQDAGIWKAILCEPPADQLPLRREIGQQLEPWIRPMAENGSLPQPVARFLGEWFEWFSVQEAIIEQEQAQQSQESEENDPQNDVEPLSQTANFWPAVIGWIIGLVILTMIFGGMGVGG
ncbi:J domain-containing protein [Marinobacter litoralis]|uniref:J domain-containing protein n=1 Tax=Marinobacter litoralis TaxID=187981 RepID=UPI0018EA9312|nr:J domain-containing protein [Marinobacter litoralis]MBJ6138945.1 J domain-containing protein [Marinobacter litoralis]